MINCESLATDVVGVNNNFIVQLIKRPIKTLPIYSQALSSNDWTITGTLLWHFSYPHQSFQLNLEQNVLFIDL